MLFNSIEFAVFLPIVFLLYWFVFDYALQRCRHQLFLQNLFIVVVSYIFYGWGNWRVSYPHRFYHPLFVPQRHRHRACRVHTYAKSRNDR